MIWIEDRRDNLHIAASTRQRRPLPPVLHVQEGLQPPVPPESDIRPFMHTPDLPMNRCEDALPTSIALNQKQSAVRSWQLIVDSFFKKPYDLRRAQSRKAALPFYALEFSAVRSMQLVVSCQLFCNPENKNSRILRTCVHSRILTTSSSQAYVQHNGFRVGDRVSHLDICAWISSSLPPPVRCYLVDCFSYILVTRRFKNSYIYHICARRTILYDKYRKERAQSRRARCHTHTGL
jgi:hypothetical protein